MPWAGVPNTVASPSDNDPIAVENVTVAVQLFTGPENGKVKSKIQVPNNTILDSTKLLHVIVCACRYLQLHCSSKAQEQLVQEPIDLWFGLLLVTLTFRLTIEEVPVIYILIVISISNE